MSKDSKITGPTVLIGCRLPNGIILEAPKDPSKKVRIRGVNQATIVGADYALTTVPTDFWEAWIEANKEFAPYQSNAIFLARDESEAASKAKELKKEKTGLEPVDPESNGVKPAEGE